MKQICASRILSSTRFYTGVALVALTLGLSGCETVSSKIGNFGQSPFIGQKAQETTTSDYLKARFAAHQQNLDFAAEGYDNVADDAPHQGDILQSAFFYGVVAGDIPKAAHHAQAILDKEEPKDSDLPTLVQAFQSTKSLPILTLAAVEMRNGRYKEALDVLHMEHDSIFGKSIGVMLEAWATYEVQGAAAALEIFDNVDKDVFTGFFALHQALILDISGNVEEARKGYKAALSSFSNTQSIMAYADFVERHDSREDAIELYRKMASDYGAVRRNGRLGLARLGVPLEGEAKAFIKQASQQPETFIENGSDGAALAFLNFAAGAYERGATEQAAALNAGFTRLKPSFNLPLSFAQLAAYTNEDLAPAHFLIGLVYQNYEQPEDAKTAFETLNFTDPNYELAQIYIAAQHQKLDDEEEAIEVLLSYVDQDPLALEAALSLSDYLVSTEDFARSEKILTRTIDRTEVLIAEDVAIKKSNDEEEVMSKHLSANLWRYYFSRGASRIQSEQYDLGIADLQKVLETEPEEPNTLNYLGYTWAERGENLEEAFAMIERALELRPNSGAIIDSLGWAHFQLGNYAEALMHIEQAVKYEVTDPVITDHLGDVYWRLGRETEARYQWQYALSLEPSEKLEGQLKDKLKNGLPPLESKNTGVPKT